MNLLLMCQCVSVIVLKLKIFLSKYSSYKIYPLKVHNLVVPKYSQDCTTVTTI